MFETRVLRKIFGPKREELTREGRKLHTEKLNVTCNIFGCSPACGV
jgi:hypothetical protein